MSLLTPDYGHCALLIMDFQNDFVFPGAPFEIAGSYEAFFPLQQLVTAVRNGGMPIVHVVRAYLPDGSNADLCRREMLRQGTALLHPYARGTDFPDALKPAGAPKLDWDALMQGVFQPLGEKEWVMYKPRWGAFYHTELEKFLREKEVNTLLFAGCNFPNCPRASIYEASERDFRLILAADAMSGLYEKGVQ